MAPVKIILYRWAGSWGPFRIKIPCGECSLTRDVLKDTFEKELQGIPVDFEIQDWLSNWWPTTSSRCCESTNRSMSHTNI